MSTFEWNNRYALGIKKIDEQHKHLFDLIDKAFDLFKSSSLDHFDETVKLIEELEQYVARHFSEEEKGLKAMKYPDVDAHKAKHIAFSDKIAQEKKNIIATRKLNVALLGFLINWLQNHIDKDDRNYAAYAQSINASNSF